MPLRTRAGYLDLFKTMLVLGMVAAHVIQLLGFGMKPGPRGFADFINLISFSGYMFAFGLGVGLPRSKRSSHFTRALWPALVMLASVYVSSLAFLILVEREAITASLLIDLFSLRVLFGYSEFLATFFLLYIVVALCRRWLLAIAENLAALAIAIAAGLASTALVADFQFPLIGAVVGHAHYATFPLLAYLPWFLIGIHAGRREGRIIDLWHLVPAAAATAAFYVYVSAQGEYPGRFPPTILWVAGPALWLLAYLALARLADRHIRVPGLLLLPGRHVLSALIISNLTIFGVRYLFRQPVRDVPSVVLFTAAILALIIAYLVLATLLAQRFKRQPTPR